MTAKSPKLSIPLKLAFSLGWPVESLMLISFELFLLFFYTQVLGLSGTLTGLALLLAMMFDGVSDPIIGTFSDNLRKARFGRRHTLMFLAPLPLGLFFVLVFCPPAGLQSLGLFLWLTITAIGARVACAMFIIPYSTQSAEMSRDTTVRSSLAIYKSVAQTIFQFLLIGLSFKLFFAASPQFANGQENHANYLPFGLAWGVVLVAITGLSAAGTYRFMHQVESTTPMAAPKPMSLIGFMSSWRAVLGRPSNVRVIFFGAIAAGTGSAIARALTSHMGIYFWQLTPSQIATWQQVTVVCTFIGLFLGHYLVKRCDTKPVIVSGMALTYLAYTIPPLLRLTGILPPGAGPVVLYTLYAANVVSGIGLGFIVMMSGLMSAQASDEEELRMGSPQQGMTFGFIFLATKIGSGLGKLFSGMILDFIKFPIGKPTAVVPQAAIHDLGLTMIVCVLVLGSLSLLIWSRFSITRGRQTEITSVLAQRNLDRTAAEVP